MHHDEITVLDRSKLLTAIASALDLKDNGRVGRDRVLLNFYEAFAFAPVEQFADAIFIAASLKRLAPDGYRANIADVRKHYDADLSTAEMALRISGGEESRAEPGWWRVNGGSADVFAPKGA